jgi:hypothetical protein
VKAENCLRLPGEVEMHYANHHRVNELPKLANRELKEAKDSLANAEVVEVGADSFTRLRINQANAIQAVFCQHAMVCMSTGALLLLSVIWCFSSESFLFLFSSKGDS